MSIDTLNLAIALCNTLAAKGSGHFARPAGSSLTGIDTNNGEAVYAFLLGLVGAFEEVTDAAKASGAAWGGCRYFRAKLPEAVVGMEGIALLSELDDADLARVRIVKGHHGGLELQLPGAAKRETNIAHMIVGDPTDGRWPPGHDAVVFTWYPGRLTPPVVIGGATVKFV